MNDTKRREDSTDSTMVDQDESLESSISNCKQQLEKLQQLILQTTDAIIYNEELSLLKKQELHGQVTIWKSVYQQLVELECSLNHRRDNLALSRSLKYTIMTTHSDHHINIYDSNSIMVKTEDTGLIPYIPHSPSDNASMTEISTCTAPTPQTANIDNDHSPASDTNGRHSSDKQPNVSRKQITTEFSSIQNNAGMPQPDTPTSDPKTAQTQQRIPINKSNSSNNNNNKRTDRSYLDTSSENKSINRQESPAKPSQRVPAKRKAPESHSSRSDSIGIRRTSLSPSSSTRNNEIMNTKKTRSEISKQNTKPGVNPKPTSVHGNIPEEETISVTVKHKYNVSKGDKMFSLEPNEQVTLLNIYNNGWCIAQSSGGVKSLAPTNLLSEMGTDETDTAIIKARAISSYIGRHKHEASFKINEDFLIINKLKSAWYLIEKESSSHLVPGLYFWNPEDPKNTSRPSFPRK
ncbi:hypothetical protein BDB01DRAFT_847832 [Pilobolus umbonatus]|nr:hypothetical protein BDB01DRAFT_847832 [Pilobolus umbonatus]